MTGQPSRAEPRSPRSRGLPPWIASWIRSDRRIHAHGPRTRSLDGYHDQYRRRGDLDARGTMTTLTAPPQDGLSIQRVAVVLRGPTMIVAENRAGPLRIAFQRGFRSATMLVLPGSSARNA